MENDLPRSPLNISSVDELIASHAKKFGRKEAIIAVDPDTNQTTRLSYQQLDTLVRKTAGLLDSFGIKKGDRFAILMHNAPEVLVVELASALIGATAVPLDFKRDTTDRKIFKLRDTSAKALLIKYEGTPNQKETDEIKKAIPNLTVQSWHSLKEFIDLLPSEPHTQITGALEDTYVILYTSGTTAHPKGVILSVRACLLNAMGIIAWQQFTSDDRFNIVLPLHHINSTEFCLSMLLVGGTIILNSHYSASKFWKIVSEHKATNTSIVPTILHDLLVRHDEFTQNPMDTSTLKRICIGSAPVFPEETLRFYDAYNVRVVQGYGQTETALRVAGVPVDTDNIMYRAFVKSNTIGNELANNHLAILDDANNQQNENQQGEICIAGPILADGYLNNPEETSKSFKDGWFHSGDLGTWNTINGKKYFYIIGRIKEIIIKGGVNLSPSAIEDALLQSFPEIDEVSIVGHPDERMGEEVAAVIVTKEKLTAAKSTNLIQTIVNKAQMGNIRGLSAYEAPKKIFFLDDLPKTSTGKIQRVEVKKIVANLLKNDIQKHYFVRLLRPDETDQLARAVEINNQRWLGLPATLDQFIARATNGLVYGVFEEKKGLVGSLSCVRLPHEEVEALKTWDEVTVNGTLSNNNPKGDTLLCIAISVFNSTTYSPPATAFDEDKLKQLAKQKIEEYVRTGKDHVLEFHRKPKGGIAGATIWKILENGRPDDKESMGYNVLMKYPAIDKGTKIVRNGSSPSVLLIETALRYAKEQGIAEVIAFSRPVGFQKYLQNI